MWQSSVEIIKPHVVKIITPSGLGTGFQISTSKTENICAVATAAHVINHAYYWEEPIRLFHEESQTTVLLHHDQRVILVDADHDTAAIIFNKELVPFPPQTLTMTTEGKYIKIGSELGWMGYPAVSPTDLCLFSGRASCYREKEGAYLVDGVAINGVSGGPAFVPLTKSAIMIVGVVSAYISNRATGEPLPGLCVIQDVIQFQGLAKRFKTLDQAKKEETPPIPPPNSLPGDQSSNEQKPG